MAKADPSHPHRLHAQVKLRTFNGLTGNAQRGSKSEAIHLTNDSKISQDEMPKNISSQDEGDQSG